MNFEEIERLVRLVAGTDLSEVEIKRAGVHLRISRQAAAAQGASHVHPPQVMHWSPAPMAHVTTAAPGAPAAALAGAATPAASEPAPDETGLHVITATMVGTFYRRPNPEAPPFVKEGDTVRKGQVICILEAMKILNEIECDVGGTVVKVHAEDAQPVEFGEKLFTIRLS